MNEEKDLIIAMELEKLQTENQQLKEKYLKAVADYETTKSEWYQLNSTLEEIREYVETNTCWDLRTSKLLQIIDKGK